LDRRALPLAVLLAAAAGILARPLGPGPLRLELGGFENGLTSGAWERADRADLDPQATSDGVTSFYFKPSPPNASLHLPVVAPGATRLTLRASARVRSGVSVFRNGARVDELLVQPRLWSRYALELPADPRGSLELALALRPLPLVKGDHVDSPRLLLDFVELQSAAGLSSSWRACLRVALVPLLVFAFCRAVSLGPLAALWGALAAGVAATLLARAAPFATYLAIPRLLPLALIAGWLAHAALRRARALSHAGPLAALVALGTLLHGSLVFFPDHNPPDIDIHVRRTLDLGGVPFDYQALLRYGSQLPTASQDQGAATAALGERTLIPYSPLPYFFYYAFHLLGLDLYWAMTGLNAALAMLVAPALFVAARSVWNPFAGWLAALLYVLDLAVWHHVGRSHAPAVFGNALAVVALLLLATQAGALAAPRRTALVGAALGVAALGYSSSVVLFGLLGLVLLALLAVDAAGLELPARRGVAQALVLGGLLAGVLFYFHYVPGLLSGARGVEAEPDLFPGRTFFIFHNESRQSMRLWQLGFAWPVAAGLLAAPFAVARAARSARPVLVAWLGAWALIMFLKEPQFFPKLLRWAKEDQFLSPILCLTLAAACAAIKPRWLRASVAGLLLLGALLLQLRDFRHHASSLLL
jgi:hypothetical protein